MIDLIALHELLDELLDEMQDRGISAAAQSRIAAAAAILPVIERARERS